MPLIGEEQLQRALSFFSGPIAKGSITSVVIRVSGLALGFFQSVFVARLLGAEGYGLAATALAISQVAAIVVLFGTAEFSVREVPRLSSKGEGRELRRLLLTFAAIVIVSGALLACLLLGLRITFAEQPGISIQILTLSLLTAPTLALIRLVRGFAQGLGKVGLAQWPGDLLRPALLTVVVALLYYSDRDTTPLQFLSIFVVAALITLIVATTLVWRQLPKAVNSLQLAKVDFGKTMPFFGISIMAVLASEFATLTLAILSTPEQTGLFQPIARFSLLLALPTTAVGMRYAPRVSELYEARDMEVLRSITRKVTLSTTLVTATLASGLALSAPWLLQLFGPEFMDTAPLLWISGIAYTIFAALGPVGLMLSMTGHANLALRARTIGLLSGIVCAALLIPEYGAMGAVLATSLTLLATKICALIFLRSRADIFS